MKDRTKEERKVEEAVDICFEVAKYQGQPFKYLYLNPDGVRSVQYFSKWVQKWAANRCYMVLLRAAHITGYEPVPAALLYHHSKRDGFGGRSVRVGSLTFYLLRLEEMSPGLTRRYEKFREQLYKEIEKKGTKLDPSSKQVAQNTSA